MNFIQYFTFKFRIYLVSSGYVSLAISHKIREEIGSFTRKTTPILHHIEKSVKENKDFMSLQFDFIL